VKKIFQSTQFYFKATHGIVMHALPTTTQVNDKLNQFLIKISKEKSNLIPVMNTTTAAAPSNNNNINTSSGNNNNNNSVLTYTTSTKARSFPHLRTTTTRLAAAAAANTTNITTPTSYPADNNFKNPTNNINNNDNSATTNVNRTKLATRLTVPHHSNRSNQNQDIISNSIYLSNILRGNFSNISTSLNSVGSSVSSSDNATLGSNSSSFINQHQRPSQVSPRFSPMTVESSSSSSSSSNSDNGYSSEEHTVNLASSSSPPSALFEMSNHASYNSTVDQTTSPEELACNDNRAFVYQPSSMSTDYDNSDSVARHLLVININSGINVFFIYIFFIDFSSDTIFKL
jgi:hypothetical protein